MTERRNQDLPPDVELDFDASVRVVDEGRVLIGGSPLRILRLTGAGADLVGRWRQGSRVGTGRAARRLARRLLDGGLAHPVWPVLPAPGSEGSIPGWSAADVTVVIPTYGRAEGLAATLAAVHADAPARVVVVDDGSAPTEATAIAAVAATAGAELVRRPTNGGPAAARNTGLDHVVTALVAFVDCDVVPTPGWLDRLLVHFRDPAVVAVAPRVRSRASAGAPAAERTAGRTAGRAADVLARFDQDRSPLDLGPVPARVAPRSRVAYVPTTALVVGVDAVEAVGRFDPSLHHGEDVDLVWRLVGAGGVVRYEPAAVVWHPPRSNVARWLRQRVDYGSSAAPLAARHPGALAPVSVSVWSAAAWGLAAAGYPLPGAAVAAGAASRLPRKLEALAHPWTEGLRLAGWGSWQAWRPLSSAVTRTWWPLAVGASMVSRRARRTVVAAAVVPPLVDWWQGDRALDPLRYVALRLADDLAYGTGVWVGCARERTLEPLRPDLRSWPGRTPVTD